MAIWPSRFSVLYCCKTLAKEAERLAASRRLRTAPEPCMSGREVSPSLASENSEKKLARARSRFPTVPVEPSSRVKLLVARIVLPFWF